jgi:hypothetical protein
MPRPMHMLNETPFLARGDAFGQDMPVYMASKKGAMYLTHVSAVRCRGIDQPTGISTLRLQRKWPCNRNPVRVLETQCILAKENKN